MHVVHALSVELVDGPEVPARETLNEESLFELADSIRAVGLIEPIIVEQVGTRYRVIAGHRRLLAHRVLNAATIPAIVRPPSDVSGEAIKVHENTHREDLNTAEEAVYFQGLLERLCAGDTDQLADLVKQSREYVEGRLLLLSSDPRVFGALKEGHISYSVARELNMVRSDTKRALYLDAAVRGGCSAKQARQWRTDGNRLEALQDSTSAGPAATDRTSPPVAGSLLVCIACGQSEAPHELELVYLHRGCRRLTIDPLLRTLRGEA